MDLPTIYFDSIISIEIEKVYILDMPLENNS